MQVGRTKFTFRTKCCHDFCEICIRIKASRILSPEVRNHERGRKKADSLGSGGSQTPGDPLRPPGKPGAKHGIIKTIVCCTAGVEEGLAPPPQRLARPTGIVVIPFNKQASESKWKYAPIVGRLAFKPPLCTQISPFCGGLRAARPTVVYSNRYGAYLR